MYAEQIGSESPEAIVAKHVEAQQRPGVPQACGAGFYPSSLHSLAELAKTQQGHVTAQQIQEQIAKDEFRSSIAAQWDEIYRLRIVVNALAEIEAKRNGYAQPAPPVAPTA